VRDLAISLVESGSCATVLVGGSGEAVEEFERNGIEYRSIPHLRRGLNPLRDCLAIGEIVQALRETAPDVVHTHTAKAGCLGRIASRIVGVPALFTPHGWAISDRVSSVGGPVFRIAERLAAPFTSAIINVCEAERELALHHKIAHPSKLAVIHNGVRDIPAGLLADARKQPPRLAMVARFEAPKDHSTLLHALAPLRSERWDLEFIGCGPGENSVRSLVQQLGLIDRVHFSGTASNVAEFLANAQIFVLTSRSEGLPYSILEAMRAGLPVVASAVGGVAEAVAHGETGFLVPKNDPTALTQILARLIAVPQLRSRLGCAGRRRYELLFTFEGMSDKTLALYGEVLGKAGNVSAQAEKAYGVN
jgi:glycosyltransferase involved in cell wall biosynthesis